MFEPFSKVTLFELDVLGSLSQHNSLRSLGRSKNLKPPHLSKILLRLEQKLKSQLIRRSSKGYLLTPDGSRLVHQAHAVLSAAEELLETTPKENAEKQKFLSFAASRFVALVVVAPKIEILRTGNVATRFRLLDMAPEELIPAALRSACDVLVTIGEPSLSKAWEITRVGSISWGLFSSLSHPLRGKVSENKLKDFPFLVPTYWAGESYEPGEDHCPLPWKKRLRGDEISSVLTALNILKYSKSQLLYAPKLVVNLQKKDFKEIQVKEWPEVSKPLYVSVRSDRVSHRAYHAIIDTFKEALV